VSLLSLLCHSAARISSAAEGMGFTICTPSFMFVGAAARRCRRSAMGEVNCSRNIASSS
jgi:hypothetical protein